MRNSTVVRRMPFKCIFALLLSSLSSAFAAAEDGPSWLCAKVLEVAVESPCNNVIGFKQGDFKLVGPLHERRISFPEGCRENQRSQESSGEL